MDVTGSTKALAGKSAALGGEFKAFISKGNVVDLAVGVIIGGAFGKIVSSLVADIIMPPLGLMLAKVDFKDLAVVLRPAEKEMPAVTLKYGLFLQSTIDFLIIAFVIFLMVKIIASMNRKQETAVPTMRDCPKCLMAVPIKATKCGHCTVEIA